MIKRYKHWSQAKPWYGPDGEKIHSRYGEWDFWGYFNTMCGRGLLASSPCWFGVIVIVVLVIMQ